MLTNPRDAFKGQSMSPNIVPFHMLGTLSSCAIVFVFKTNSNNVILIFDFKKFRDLDIRVRGHSTSLKVVGLPFYRMRMISYQCSIEILSLRCTIFEIFDFKNIVILKTTLGVGQGHWKCHNSIERIRLPIDVL